MKCPHCEKLFFVDVCDPNNSFLGKPSKEELVAAADALDKVITGKFGANLIEISDALRVAARSR